MEHELRMTYQVLCSAAYWLSAQTYEGEEVLEAIRFQIRQIENVLKLPEKAALASEPTEPVFLANLRAAATTESKDHAD